MALARNPKWVEGSPGTKKEHGLGLSRTWNWQAPMPTKRSAVSRFPPPPLPSSQCLLQMKLVLFINKNLFSPFPLLLRQLHLQAQAILELMSLVAILLSQDPNTKIIKVTTTTLNTNFF